MNSKTSQPSQHGNSLLPHGLDPSRLPLWRVLIYSMGCLAGMTSGATSSLSLNIFNITLGVDVAVVTTAMMIVQLTGIFLDPIIANFSDNFVTRWGRRRPLIVIGSIIAGIAFAALWMFPTGWSEHQYFLWYLGLSLVMNLGNALYGAGYFALGIEIATDYEDRTRIMAVRSYFAKLTALVGPWLFFIAQWQCFSNALEGARWIGAIVGAFVIAMALPSAILTKERFADLTKKEEELELEKKPMPKLWDPLVNFFKTIASIGDNRYFWMTLGVSMTLSSGLALFEQFGNYVTIYYVFGGDTLAGAKLGGWGNTLGVGLSILAIPLAQILCNRFGKHQVLKMALGWMLVGSILKWWCYNPEYPYLILVIPIFYSVGISSFWLILPAMQADVVDVDELHSSKRREAMFGAVTNLGFRFSGAVASGLMGYILNATGFVRDLAGEQAPETFFWMRFLYSFAMAFAILLSLLFLFKYDLTAGKMEEIRQVLQKRREQIKEA